MESIPRSGDPNVALAWNRLLEEACHTESISLRQLFQDSKRFDTFSLNLDTDFLVDFSKNHVSQETLDLLLKLSEVSGLARGMAQLAAGKYLNGTENIMVRHTLLRRALLRSKGEPTPWEASIRKGYQALQHISEKILSGVWCGFSGKPITTVVNIGIGGSHLGAMMLSCALKPYASHLETHYISNVDGSSAFEVLKSLDAETTIFIIVSKTFKTQETLTNAERIKAWFFSRGGRKEHMPHHFFAITDSENAAVDFGIPIQNIFPVGSGVGGRFSISSAASFAVMLSVGVDHFESFLNGAREMDEHFFTADFHRNIPVILALIGIWYQNFRGMDAQLILPYDVHLRHFPTYLQQLVMESNGKRADQEGRHISYATGPLIWGGVGTDVQHSFFQLLHQGVQKLHCDFLCATVPSHPFLEHHQELVSHVLSQSKAMMLGGGVVSKTLDAHREFPGNKPSNTILYRSASPETLGKLVSMYEHKTFVQGFIWNINSFDQWGVALGKKTFEEVLPHIREETLGAFDASTEGLLRFYHRR